MNVLLSKIDLQQQRFPRKLRNSFVTCYVMDHESKIVCTIEKAEQKFAVIFLSPFLSHELRNAKHCDLFCNSSREPVSNHNYLSKKENVVYVLCSWHICKKALKELRIN